MYFGRCKNAGPKPIASHDHLQYANLFSMKNSIIALIALAFCGLAPGNGSPSEPGRDWEIHLIHHTHVDIGYTNTQDEVMRKQWRNLETAMDLADASADMPEPARFRWNPEVNWAIETWLDQAGEDEKDRFIRQVRQGSVGLDAMFSNMLTGLMRPEEFYRALAYKGELELMTGKPIDSAMITDVPGWSWGLGAALSQNGVKYLSIGTNAGHRIGHVLEDWGDKPFYWTSPTGKDRVLVFIHGKGYSWFHTPVTLLTGETNPPNKFTPGRLFRYLRELDKRGYPYSILPIRYAVGADNGPPDPEISRVVAEWNEKYPRVQVRLTTVSESFSEFERRHGKELPVFTGDFTPYWEDGAASTARETAIARNAAEKLETAQVLWSLLDPGGFPEARFHQAWNQVMLFNEHTWGAWNSITVPDAKFVKSQWDWKKTRALEADQMAEDLLGEILKADGAGDRVSVINPHSWTVSGPVVLPNPAGLRVETSDGKPVPSQVLAGGRLFFMAGDVDGFTENRYLLTDGPPSSPDEAGCKVGENWLENEHFKVVLDTERGNVSSILDKRSGTEYVNNDFEDGFNEYVYVRGRSPRLGKRKSRDPRPGFRVLESGPLVCSIEVERRAPMTDSLKTEVAIYAGLDRIDLINELDRPRVRSKEGVHFAFPVKADGPAVRYDLAWGAAEVDKDQITGACKNYFTPLRWVDVSGPGHGLQITLIDAPLFEAGAITADATRVKWLRQTEHNGSIYSYVMNNYWETNYKADQPGVTRFRYALFPHREYDPAENSRRGLEVARPLVAAAGGSNRPMPEPPITTSNPDIIVESLKPTPGGALTARLVNLAGQERTARLGGNSKCQLPSGSDEITLERYQSINLECR